jgi:hypothetical protein
LRPHGTAWAPADRNRRPYFSSRPQHRLYRLISGLLFAELACFGGRHLSQISERDERIASAILAEAN